MKRLSWLSGVILVVGAVVAEGQWARAVEPVLIVADEFPAMELLAGRLQAEENLATRIVSQAQLPPTLTDRKAVVVYIHGRLTRAAERAMIDYTEAGGRLVVLHHSISSGKRTNEFWFKFLGVELSTAPLEAGGYKWIEPAHLTVVNLAPDHYLTTHRVTWPLEVAYRPENGTAEKPHAAFALPESEVYLNHRLTRPRTPVLGFRYVESGNGRVWMQDRAGWYQPAGRGWLFYFQPGHSAADFRDPTFSRIVINAVVWPAPKA